MKGGVSPPKIREIFENLILKWRPLVASKSQNVQQDDAQKGMGFESQDIFKSLNIVCRRRRKEKLTKMTKNKVLILVEMGVLIFKDIQGQIFKFKGFQALEKKIHIFKGFQGFSRMWAPCLQVPRVGYFGYPNTTSMYLGKQWADLSL